MKYFYPLLIITLVFNNFIHAQSVFVKDTVYLPGKNIKKVTSFNNLDTWFLCDDTIQSIYKIDKYGNLINKTADLIVPRNAIITDIVSMGENELLIGTLTNYAYYYKNNQLIHIDTSYGLDKNDTSVSSLTYMEGLNGYFYTRNIGIATNGSIYISDSINTLNKFGSYTNAKLLNKNKAFLISYVSETGTPLIEYRNYHGMYGLFRFTPLASNNINCGNVSWYDSGNLLAYGIGTDSGFYSSNFSSNRVLPKQKINSYISIEPNSSYFFVAADSGVYFYQIDNNGLEYIDLGVGFYSAYEIVKTGLNYTVATNKGLIVFQHYNCNSYTVDIKQNLNYLSLQNNDSIKFEIANHSIFDDYKWDFGDGFSTTIHYPTHKYDSIGNYKISFITTNGYCYDTTNTIATVFNDTSEFSTNFSQYKNYPFGTTTTINGVINLIDADGDNDLDVFMPYAGLFENCDSNGFYLKNTGFNLDLHNCLWGDLDNDGLNDIISGSIIYKNLGNFKFQDKEISSHYPYYSSYTFTSLYDFDQNGYLDIISGSGQSVSIFYNKGGLIFEQFDSLTSFNNYNSYIEDVKMFDIDNDNDFDLLICINQGGNQVFTNDNGIFNRSDYHILTDISSYSGPVGDINNDRKYDYYTCGGYTFGQYNVYLLSNKNDSLKKLEDTWLTSEFSDYYNQPLGFNQATFTDLDNNGYLDCLKHVWPPEYNRVFMNLGDNIFVHDVSNPFNKTTGVLSRSIASSDLTNDGFPEILVGYGDIYHDNTNEPNYLFINQTSNNKKYIKIKCLGSSSNLNAIGAKVSVKCKINGNDEWQQRQIISNTNKYAQEGYDALFGVGENDYIDSLIINWPSGITTVMENLQANKYYQIIEPNLRITGNAYTCENEGLLLSVASNKLTKYKWYLNNEILLNDTLPCFKPINSGSYKCQIINPDYELFTNSVDVLVKPVSKAGIRFDDSTGSFCDGFSIKILSNSYPGAKYHWYINTSDYLTDTISELEIDQIAKFYNIIENEYGCFDTSNTLIPDIFFKPDVGVYDEVYYCSGSSIELNLDNSFLGYKWYNGDTTSFTSFNSEGSGFLELTDSICTYRYDFDIIEGEYPEINIGPDTLIRHQAVYYPLITCNDSYFYLWNDGDSICNKPFNYLNLNEGANEITLSVTNQFNCESTDTAIISYTKSRYSAIKALTGFNKINIYPNPAKDKVFIELDRELSATNLILEILTSSGQKVYSERIYGLKSEKIIDLTGFENGIYNLLIKANDEIISINKLIITK